MNKLRCLRRVLPAACLATAASATAAEGGASNYPYGALTTLSALLPPPTATEFYGYTVELNADRIADVQGNAIPGAEARVFAAAPRVVHSWKPTPGGFTLSSGMLLELEHVSVDIGGNKGSASGTTLFGIEPLYLSRGFGPLHLLTGPVVYFPLGGYNAADLANSTASFGSWAWELSGTLIPTPRWDLSLALVSEFKSSDKQTHYKSGTQAGISYGFSYRPFADTRWEFGVTGFYTRQIADDRIDGATVAGGGRTQEYAFGPKLAYWLNPATPLIFQWHREHAVRNAPQGDLFWFEFGFPLP